tara:strand:+ start:1829 stop:2701 length:873 start_codon:yes stop_codon:yes gene_type:complete
MYASGFQPFEAIAIVGLGLIGGSVAKDVRRLGLARKILGYDNNEEYHKEIKSEKLADYLSSMPDKKLAQAELVLLAVPVKSFKDILPLILPNISSTAILTDTGSVKSPLLKMMCSHDYENIRFLGGHPIAGSENFGPSAAQNNLFFGKRCIITPEEKTDKESILVVRRFWESMGAKVSEMDPESHDQMFASVSHLPHILAYACIQAISNTDSNEALGHSGAGLKDFSRIASSSPEMWADIFLENQEKLLPRVVAFKKVLSSLEEKIKNNDKKKLVELLALSKTARDRWML